MAGAAPGEGGRGQSEAEDEPAGVFVSDFLGVLESSEDLGADDRFDELRESVA